MLQLIVNGCAFNDVGVNNTKEIPKSLAFAKIGHNFTLTNVKKICQVADLKPAISIQIENRFLLNAINIFSPFFKISEKVIENSYCFIVKLLRYIHLLMYDSLYLG